MKVQVYDQDMINDDFVGEAYYNLAKIYNMPNLPQNGISLII
jgi:hypothetical protein